MVEKDYAALKEQIDILTGSIDEISFLMDKLLSQQDKGFTVTFRNKTYDLHPATTRDEDCKMFHDRLRLTKQLLKHCASGHIENYPKPSDHIWNDILCFTMGVDTRDCQFEIIRSTEVASNINDEQGVRSVPLDQDNYQVKMQSQEVSPREINDVKKD
jgi:hypothetical protein